MNRAGCATNDRGRFAERLSRLIGHAEDEGGLDRETILWPSLRSARSRISHACHDGAKCLMDVYNSLPRIAFSAKNYN
jgi:hypothetical protein